MGAAPDSPTLVLRMPLPRWTELLPGAAERDRAEREWLRRIGHPAALVDVVAEGLDCAALVARCAGAKRLLVGPDHALGAAYRAALRAALAAVDGPAIEPWPAASKAPPERWATGGGRSAVDEAVALLRRADPPRARLLLREYELWEAGIDPRLDVFLGRDRPAAGPEESAAGDEQGLMHIVVEGIDGSGKSSQAAAIRDWLERRGYRSEVHKACRSGPFYARITAIMKALEPTGERTFWRWCRQAKAQDTVRVVAAKSAAAAARGIQVIIWDRYRATHLAASLARFGCDPWVAEICARLPRPRASFLLDLPVAESLARVDQRSSAPTLDEQPFTLARYRRGFRVIAPAEGLHIIDGTRPRERVTAEILEQLTPLFPVRGGKRAAAQATAPGAGTPQPAGHPWEMRPWNRVQVEGGRPGALPGGAPADRPPLLVLPPGSREELRFAEYLDRLPPGDWVSLPVDELDEALAGVESWADPVRVWMPLWPHLLAATLRLAQPDPVLRIMRAGGIRWVAGRAAAAPAEESALARWFRQRPSLLADYERHLERAGRADALARGHTTGAQP